MDPVDPRFLADPSSSRERMEQMQREIGREAIFEDRFDFKPKEIEDRIVLGVDQAFLDDKAVSAAVAIKNGEVIEKAHGVSDLKIPYIPGLLAFREAPSIVKSLEKLSIEPDLAFFDGSGRIHFRQAGIATHMGLLFDIPSIGIAKNLLCGRKAEETEGLAQDEKIAIFADNSVNAPEGTLIGYAFQSRQYENSSNYINPLYISSGHRVSAETAVDLTEKFCKSYKMPEPVLLADNYADEAKLNYSE